MKDGERFVPFLLLPARTKFGQLCELQPWVLCPCPLFQGLKAPSTRIAFRADIFEANWASGDFLRPRDNRISAAAVSWSVAQGAENFFLLIRAPFGPDSSRRSNKRWLLRSIRAHTRLTAGLHVNGAATAGGQEQRSKCILVGSIRADSGQIPGPARPETNALLQPPERHESVEPSVELIQRFPIPYGGHFARLATKALSLNMRVSGSEASSHKVNRTCERNSTQSESEYELGPTDVIHCF